MSMCKADPERAVCDHFGQGEIRSFDVEIPLDHLEIGGDLTEKIVGFFIGEIAQEQDLADFARREEFSKLRRWGEKRVSMSYQRALGVQVGVCACTFAGISWDQHRQISQCTKAAGDLDEERAGWVSSYRRPVGDEEVTEDQH